MVVYLPMYMKTALLGWSLLESRYFCSVFSRGGTGSGGRESSSWNVPSLLLFMEAVLMVLTEGKNVTFTLWLEASNPKHLATYILNIFCTWSTTQTERSFMFCCVRTYRQIKTHGVYMYQNMYTYWKEWMRMLLYNPCIYKSKTHATGPKNSVFTRL